MQTRSALGVSTHAAIRGSFLEVGTRRSHCVVQIPRREAVVVVETLLQSMVQALRVDGTRSMAMCDLLLCENGRVTVIQFAAADADLDRVIRLRGLCHKSAFVSLLILVFLSSHRGRGAILGRGKPRQTSQNRVHREMVEERGQAGRLLPNVVENKRLAKPLLRGSGNWFRTISTGPKSSPTGAGV